MIDTNEIENKGDWTNDYKVKMFWDLVTEVKNLREIFDEWSMMWAILEELNLAADVRDKMKVIA
jgi:hypothetical protein|tara:strand:- start:3417 stop:3608 length:192 start_codon:yes stop_codon:yes gene_type:complete